MIKFFRRIRQTLVSEHKFSKYLLYAIGEIVLVVIGILIALQINNWNEKQKTKNSELSYLKSIKNDLASDYETINYIIGNTSKRIEAFESLKEKLRSFDTISDSRKLYELAHNNRGFVDLQLGDNTIETLKNSGNIELISSTPIRNGIQNYYDTAEIIYKSQDYMNGFIVNTALDTFFNVLECEKGIEGNYKVPFDARARENLPDVYNYVKRWLTNMNRQLQMLKRLGKKNRELVHLIASNYQLKERHD